MNRKKQKQLSHAWTQVAGQLPPTGDVAKLETLATQLSSFATTAEECNKVTLSEGADLLSRLAEIAARWTTSYPEDPEIVVEWIEYIHGHSPLLEKGMASNESDDEINAMVELADQAWADYFLVADSDQIDDDPWGIAEENVEAGKSESDEDSIESGHQIEMLLNAFSGAVKSAEKDADTKANDTTDAAVPSTDASPGNTSTTAETQTTSVDNDQNAREELLADRELLEAWLDDTHRCVAEMEKAALALDANPADKESIRAFCRELHTLKGASATVGLSGLATRLHDLETQLEEVFSQSSGGADADKLFEAIDFVRSEMESLEATPQVPEANSAAAAATDDSNTPSAQIAPRPSGIGNFASADDASVRIRASQLDRLMDMLAELVVLRNRRESTAGEYELLHSELSRCAARLGISEQRGTASNNISLLAEVSSDIEAVSQGLRELQKPVANDNASITRFVRDFRQELMQLRRVPVSGMFSRLQRAARDAAKSESKKVRVQVVGEDTGLEQEIQERLYESLLHIVRNCVSHGIENPDGRRAAGKDETGTVTLEASSSAQLLLIEVRDDGNGVNYEAIRKRAIEKGLVAPHVKVSNAELANLIFHPGFSTKETASEISGRGVGMDVVANTLEQLKGRIEVDSVSGKGTTIRLLIPLRTGIEHVMVFRSDDQLFALPMRSVTAAKATNTGLDRVTRLAVSGNSNRQNAGSGEVLVLNRMSDDSETIALEVDQLIGPEEVVVRGLPGLIQNHPLFSGITLSGSGEKVLLLESEKVAQYCTDDIGEQSHGKSDNGHGHRKALVVDDSMTARKMLTKILHPLGFTTVEAGDGIDAIEQLHRDTFDVVFTDLDMPRLGGMELLADIQSGTYCNCPTIVVSSRNDDAFKSQALDHGASAYLTKPITKEALGEQLEKFDLLGATLQEIGS